MTSRITQDNQWDKFFSTPQIAKIMFNEQCEDSRDEATYGIPDDPSLPPVFIGWEESDKSFKRRILEALDGK